MRPKFLARLACFISVFSLASRCSLARLAPRQCIAAPPVRGVLRLLAHTRNPFFQEKRIFCDKPDFCSDFSILGYLCCVNPR